MAIRLDLNNPVFQEQWFCLEKPEQLAVLNCCGKLAAMDWNAIYRDKGLRWELIHSRTGTGKDRLYSIRVTQKIRAVVQRSGNFLEFLSLHVDHDSAYR
jgi:hypothetical protein